MFWQLVAAALAAGTASIFSDWLFMGLLFHEHYNHYPEIWRPGLHQKGGDARAIAISSALGYVTAGAIVGLCAVAGADSIPQALQLVILAWLGGPLVLLIVNDFWIKSDHLITVAHSAGWLVRFLFAGLAAGVALQ